MLNFVTKNIITEMKLSLILDNITSRLGIAELNPMQKRVMESTSANTLLLSPTGSGKTIAFTIAMLRAPASRRARSRPW